MVKKFCVKKGYSYTDHGKRLHKAGTVLTLDPVDDYVKKQLWKLEVAGDVEPEPQLEKNVPLPQHDVEAEKLINDLDFLRERKEHEPPKVVVDPKAKKPAEGVAKPEAETMLERVKKFIDEQEEKAKP